MTNIFFFNLEQIFVNGELDKDDDDYMKDLRDLNEEDFEDYEEEEYDDEE